MKQNEMRLDWKAVSAALRSRFNVILGYIRWVVPPNAQGARRVGIAAAIALLIGVVLYSRCGVAGCPDVDRLRSYQPGGASVVVDRNGQKIADLAPVEHAIVRLKDLPAHVPNAFVAVEDKRFYQHNGVDWVRVFGAAFANVKSGGIVQGSSTITMQLSRNLYPDRIRAQEKTLGRKLTEVRMAGEIEDKFTKEEILELYLNHIYFGGGAYGIEAASRYYFEKPANKLTVGEAALLAAIPKAPSNYDPRKHPEAARQRRDLVLSLMAEEGFITQENARAASQRRLGVSDDPDRARQNTFAAYYIQHLRNILEERFGERLYSSRLKITATLDTKAQRAAEASLARQLQSMNRNVQGAVVMMDAHAGDVLAWVGGRDFRQSRYDRARNARRQVGSAFKPFVYATAIGEGISPSQPILDSPYRLAMSRNDVWEPQNYDGSYHGVLSMRDALVLSQNIPAVRLARAAGENDVVELARRAGIKGKIPHSPVLALGVTEVSPLELATAYTSFASLGTRAEPRFILRVEDQYGAVLWEPEARSEAAMNPAVAYLVTDILRDAVNYGTGTAVRSAGFNGPVAGKTGTTNDATDAWFAGYTPDIVGVVWIGYDDNKPLPGRATGGSVAAPVWGRMMARIQDANPHDWQPPQGTIVSRWTDPETGLVLESGCRPRYGEARHEVFLSDYVPQMTCPRSEYDRDFFSRIGSLLGGLLGAQAEPEPALPPGPPDQNLGLPRLSTRGTSPR